jgi:DNA repair exonuclease SbcCD nuclease subunit
MSDAILTADWHLRDDQPLCRTDDFFSAQARKVKFVKDLREAYEPILDAGDLFHTWKPTHFLTAWAIWNLPDNFYTVPGTERHSGFNLESALNKSGLATLNAAMAVNLISGGLEHIGELSPFFVRGFEWGSEAIYTQQVSKGKPNVAVIHIMTYKGEKPWPGLEADDCYALLKKLPQYDLIVTGHNHKTFTCEYQGRLLVNPGSLTRQSADQADHKPCVFQWDASSNTATPVYLPIEEGVVSREHIEVRADKTSMMETYAKRLDKACINMPEFEKNLETYYSRNRTRQAVKSIINQAMEEKT